MPPGPHNRTPLATNTQLWACITQHLLTLNGISFSLDHLESLLKSSFIQTTSSLLFTFPFIFISSFIHHSPENPPFPTLVHSLIHSDLMVNGWHRFEPLPISHVPIGLGGALIATCDTGRRHRSGLDREPDVR